MVDILKELNIVSVIWIISAGILLFFLLFLFAKRQIVRFALNSNRGPYASIGSDAPKTLRQEISCHLDHISTIKFEPVLLTHKVDDMTSLAGPNHYYYRMKTVDTFSKFDEVLKKEAIGARGHHPCQTVRSYLLSLYPDYLTSASDELIHQISAAYEHARHKPEVFGEIEYEQYSKQLDDLIVCLRNGIRHSKAKKVELITLPPPEVSFNPLGKGHTRKTKTSIPYNHMIQSGDRHRSQTRYRTRANSSEQAGLLESNTSSQRSSMDGLDAKSNTEKMSLVCHVDDDDDNDNNK